jgi:hypothetical protein
MLIFCEKEKSVFDVCSRVIVIPVYHLRQYCQWHREDKGTSLYISKNPNPGEGRYDMCNEEAIEEEEQSTEIGKTIRV